MSVKHPIIAVTGSSGAQRIKGVRLDFNALQLLQLLMAVSPVLRDSSFTVTVRL